MSLGEQKKRTRRTEVLQVGSTRNRVKPRESRNSGDSVARKKKGIRGRKAVNASKQAS